MSDEKNHKITYVSICGLDKSKENVAKYSEEAMNLLDGLHRENLFLKQLIIKLINREK